MIIYARSITRLIKNNKHKEYEFYVVSIQVIDNNKNYRNDVFVHKSETYIANKYSDICGYEPKNRWLHNDIIYYNIKIKTVSWYIKSNSTTRSCKCCTYISYNK